jgi:ASC-1-like (ASCH) protein
MHHVAIMNPKWRLIPKILSGEKTIESRWYQTRRAPWDRIAAGDTVWFKDAAKPVTAKASVSEVMQFAFADVRDVEEVLERHWRDIGFASADVSRFPMLPQYAVLVRLADPQPVPPFSIDKRGFGNANAWLTVPDIARIQC